MVLHGWDVAARICSSKVNIHLRKPSTLVFNFEIQNLLHRFWTKTPIWRNPRCLVWNPNKNCTSMALIWGFRLDLHRFTLPENEDSTCQEAFPKGNSSSNHWFSGAMLVSGRVSCLFLVKLFVLIASSLVDHRCILIKNWLGQKTRPRLSSAKSIWRFRPEEICPKDVWYLDTSLDGRNPGKQLIGRAFVYSMV